MRTAEQIERELEFQKEHRDMIWNNPAETNRVNAIIHALEWALGKRGEIDG